MKQLALIFAVIALSVGCEQVDKLASHAPKHQLTVIPSAPPKTEFTVTVKDERYLSDIARRLGTTVEAIIADNHLPDASIREGQQLKVRSTAQRVAEFERLQQVRADRRRKRAEARRAAAEKAELAKKQRKRRVRRKRGKRKRRVKRMRSKQRKRR